MMSNGLFITGTDTDIGKTYVTALLIKTLRQGGYDTGYYKAAISGADSVAESDAGFVNRFAQIGEPEDLLLSYLYKTAVSPHLAAQLEGNPVDLAVIHRDFQKAAARYPYLVMEGSGGIACPLRRDAKAHIDLTDIIWLLELPVLLVAKAGLGTLNHIVTTAAYCEKLGIPVKGVLLNHWQGGVLEEDNLKMIPAMTGVPVLAKIPTGAASLDCDPKTLAACFAPLEVKN